MDAIGHLVYTKNKRTFASETHQLGRYLYHTFTEENYKSFMYCDPINDCKWAFEDFGACSSYSFLPSKIKLLFLGSKNTKRSAANISHVWCNNSKPCIAFICVNAVYYFCLKYSS